jgi:hypothetical protein
MLVNALGRGRLSVRIWHNELIHTDLSFREINQRRILEQFA